MKKLKRLALVAMVALGLLGLQAHSSQAMDTMTVSLTQPDGIKRAMELNLDQSLSGLRVALINSGIDIAPDDKFITKEGDISPQDEARWTIRDIIADNALSFKVRITLPTEPFKWFIEVAEKGDAEAQAVLDDVYIKMGDIGGLKRQLAASQEAEQQAYRDIAALTKQMEDAQKVAVTKTREVEELKRQLQNAEQGISQDIEELKWQLELAAVKEREDAPAKQLAAMEKEKLKAKEEEKRLVKMEPSIPPVARGNEAIYERFLKGTLIYRSHSVRNKGMIKLPIMDLANPLEGTFDLSRCECMGKYLSISTGYRKGNKPENARKVEVWIAPRFLIEKELNTTAAHFKSIMDNWKEEEAPVGLFWTRSGSDDMGWYDYLTTENMDNLSKANLYKHWEKRGGSARGCIVGIWARQRATHSALWCFTFRF